MSGAGRHPTDEERARDTAPTVARVATALRAEDRDGLLGALRPDAAWVSPDGVVDGADAVADALLDAVRGAAGWREPVQSGAAAVIGFSRDGAPGAVSLTVRRDGVVLVSGASR